MIDFEEEYQQLIGEVTKLDVRAALYLQEDAPLLQPFEQDGCLSRCFVWDATPQGHKYWGDIAGKIGQGGIESELPDGKSSSLDVLI
jgi:hypothetical protein